MAQQPQPVNGPTITGTIEIIHAPSIVASGGSAQELLLFSLGRYSSVLVEHIRQELDTNNTHKKIKILFEVREKLKSDFANWIELEESQKWHLETAYCYSWIYLLGLREFDKKILEEYKSDLKEDGSHTPSAICGLLQTPFVVAQATTLIPELYEDMVALLKNTKNAATISNCCHVMITAYIRVTQFEQWEGSFPDIQRVLNCWDLFREKQQALRTEPLTEHTAMGIILLDEAFAYQWAYEEEQKRIQSPIHPNATLPQKSAGSFMPKQHYLFNMEKIMTGPATVKGPFYADKIKKMLEQQ